MSRFGSWTYDGFQMDLAANVVSDSAVDWSDYDENCSYRVINASSRKNTMYYECCTEPYVDIEITIQLMPRETTLA